MSKKGHRKSKILALTIMLSYLFSFTQPVNAAVNDNEVISGIQKFPDVQIDKNSCIDLYDGTDSIVAYYYKLLPTGYIIFDSITNGIKIIL